MISPELREIFEPAYGPCVHFSGICSGTCVWCPESRLVPRGFGGATARLDMVRLVIVTSEPGNPGRDEYYGGSAGQILSTVLCNHRKHLIEGVRRDSGSDPYNQNLRKILDLCWRPDLSTIEEQLERTWITNSVKCSAPKPGDKFPEEIEEVCIETYLRKELALFANAFVLALGEDKAARRLNNCGICIDAVAHHPSARPKDNPEATWRLAAEIFREWLTERGAD